MHEVNPELITQDNFNALIAARANAQELCHALQELWETDRALVNQENFNALIREGANALDHAREIIRRAFGPAEAAAVLPIGDRQSTHLASVHKSSSDSATRLMTRYGDDIQGPNLEATLEEVRAWAGGLPEGWQAVRNSVTQLTAVDFTFKDPGSRVFMRQLLALAWKALHDDSARTGNLEDGLAQFAQGLKEIQNEYGLGMPACTGGSFNKVIEKLVGVHPDAIQLVITPGQAAAKLEIVVKEEAYKYLERMSNPKTPEALQAFTGLIAKIRAEGIGVIWPNIKDAVETKMIDEFGSIYNNSKDDAKFQELLLASVSCVELDELDRFQKQISESEGYQKWIRAGLLSFEPATAPGAGDRPRPK